VPEGYCLGEESARWARDGDGRGVMRTACHWSCPVVIMPATQLADGVMYAQHIDFALTSPFGGGPPGRVKKKALARMGGDGEDDE
jgi:hypothetical protein